MLDTWGAMSAFAQLQTSANPRSPLQLLVIATDERLARLLQVEQSIKAIWIQKKLPVILRRTGIGELLRVRLPFDDDNRRWLQSDRRNTPDWKQTKKCWEIPKAWFDDFVNRALEKYGRLYVIQPYREQEICSASCQNAKGHECQCSCMGVHHGAGSDGSWFEVSEAFSTRWGERELACRLMVAKKTE